MSNTDQNENKLTIRQRARRERLKNLAIVSGAYRAPGRPKKPPKTVDEIKEQRTAASRKQAELKKIYRAEQRLIKQTKRDKLEQVVGKLQTCDLDRLKHIDLVIANFNDGVSNGVLLQSPALISSL
jgi:hypothetical protein